MTTPDDDDTVARFAALIDALDLHTHGQATALRRNERNRLNMLFVHGAAALIIGPTLALTPPGAFTGASWALLGRIPYMPYSLATLMGLGGAILLPATYLRARRWEMTGLWMISTWYTIMALGFAGAAILWISTGHDVGSGGPTFYVPFLYLHLTAIMRVHLYTLWKMTKAERAEVSQR